MFHSKSRKDTKEATYNFIARISYIYIYNFLGAFLKIK
jgi:hypothetical protein